MTGCPTATTKVSYQSHIQKPMLTTQQRNQPRKVCFFLFASFFFFFLGFINWIKKLLGYNNFGVEKLRQMQNITDNWIISNGLIVGSTLKIHISFLCVECYLLPCCGHTLCVFIGAKKSNSSAPKYDAMHRLNATAKSFREFSTNTLALPFLVCFTVSSVFVLCVPLTMCHDALSSFTSSFIRFGAGWLAGVWFFFPHFSLCSCVGVCIVYQNRFTVTSYCCTKKRPTDNSNDDGIV